MNSRRRILGLLALLLFLSLPAQAGVSYFCQAMKTSSPSCCCPVPGPDTPPALKEPGGPCCCNQYRWDDPAPKLGQAIQSLAAVPVLTVTAVFFLEEPLPSCDWIEATTHPPDPVPPPLYLTSRSFLS
jgi:hypothetical protein